MEIFFERHPLFILQKACFEQTHEVYMKKKNKSKIEFFAFIVFIKIFKIFPYNFTRNFVGQLFQMGGMYLKIRKNVAVRQLKMIFPEKSDTEIKIILKKMYFNMGITTAEIYFGKNKNLFKKVNTQGWKNLQEAVEMKKGVILASAHFGNWQLAGEYIASFYDLSVIIKKQRNEYFHNYTYTKSIEENVTFIDQKNALRPILKLLKKNYIIAIMVDQSAGKHGVQTQFLGHLASTYVGAAKISLKTGCPVVPAIAFRNEDNSHTFIFDKMILPDTFTNDSLYIEFISKKLEEYIIKYPEQWFWVHRRWKGKKKAKKLYRNEDG